MVNIRVICDSIDPRLEYAFHELFRYTYNTSTIRFEVCPNGEFSSFALTKNDGDFLLAYSREILTGCDIHFYPCGLLESGASVAYDLDIEMSGGLPYFFQSPRGFEGELFDLPAMLFYCLSRMEEYDSMFPKDDYGRCLSTGNTLFREGWAAVPLVDLWKERFFQQLNEASVPIKWDFPHQFKLTVDIDALYAYQGRSTCDQFKGLLKDLFRLNFDGIQHRMDVMKGRADDPFDTFHFLESCCDSAGGQLQYFWHVHRGTGIDHNPYGGTPLLKQSIQTACQHHLVGLHPSRAAHQSLDQLKQEVAFVNEAIGSQILDSRMHYLLLDWPATYQNLQTVGIRRDHSLGYHDQVGYRAHTACPFLWYDLHQEASSLLEIHPFFSMDITLRKYMECTPGEAIMKLKLQKEYLASKQLPFVILWHNSSMSSIMGWSGWEDLLEQLVE